MTLENGKWVDEFGNGVNQRDMNGWKLIQLRDKSVSLYGEDGITYNRLDIVSSLIGMSSKQESVLSSILRNNVLERFRL